MPLFQDACAILLSVYHPALQLLGISTTHGNAPLSKTTLNTLSILEAIGQPQIPVIPGASRPFCRNVQPATDIHGESGLEGTLLLPVPRRKPLSHCNAIKEMHDALILTPVNTAWVVATGPCTNTALLFATYPELASHVKGVSIMGGAVGSHYTSISMGPDYLDSKGQSHVRSGNITPFAEFNIWADPESARSVFTNPILRSKTVLIPLDLTHQAYATPKIQEMLLNGTQGPTRLRTMFNELLMFFAKTYSEVFGLNEGPPLHDPLAVAVLLADHPNSGTKIPFDDRGGERWVVDVVLEGEQIGRTVVVQAMDGDGVRIPRSLDLNRFWEVLDSCMAKADEVTRYIK